MTERQREIEILRQTSNEHNRLNWDRGCDCDDCQKYAEYVSNVRKIVWERQRLKGAQ